MGVIDIALGALILFGLARGFMKGFFVEVASLIALVAGVYGAVYFSDFVADILQDKTDWSENTIKYSAFAITFIIIILAVSLAGKALTKLANFAALGIINKVLGGVFGAVKIALVLSVVLIIFERLNNTLPFANEEDLEDSLLYSPVKSLVPSIFPNVLNGEEEAEDTETNDSTKNPLQSA